MSYRIIGQDVACTIALGGLANGSVPTFGSAASFVGIAKEIGIDESLVTSDVSALADGLVKERIRRSVADVPIQLEMLNTGPQFNDKVGYAARAIIQAAAGATAETFVGYISKRSAKHPDDAVTEDITIRCALEGYTYTGVYS